ncbi:hypothetical protein Lqui_0768 [Legionella quinlivanii]|uniref:Uncharacterized protein n=1 Tax=Legionella quinlivanii TaxID=45073 RepID=A0A0W0Y5L2_9GAMM|nr:hypothetical protein [Legionella quinlivanii]KTD51924.1 hypothetical protein Lqui_0768 [Legionella quinlivanii]SEF84973.1 hypothetical protein SAMN02746093_01229 [Legionella quinlivanii DSM 21216]STY09613.1 Uncharacterised protein [Legionella quinlivanii]
MKKEDKSDDKNTNNYSASYNQFKEFKGQAYTGMKIGRSHSWNYDQGQWKERKLTPDKWEIHYAVTKRRKGKAPEGSGVPVGTKYHWYILADQIVEKLNANDYSTEMVGIKFKIAHQRADKEAWNISEITQKKHLVNYLYEVIYTLEAEIEALKKRKTRIKSTGKMTSFSAEQLIAQNEPLNEKKKSKEVKQR